MGSQKRKESFLKDFEDLLKKHNAIIEADTVWMKQTHHEEKVLSVDLAETKNCKSLSFYMLSAMPDRCQEDV